MLQVFEAAKTIIAGHPVLGPLLFVVLSALAAMLAFFSSAVLVPPAVYAWGPLVCTVLLWAGWMLGGLARMDLRTASAGRCCDGSLRASPLRDTSGGSARKPRSASSFSSSSRCRRKSPAWCWAWPTFRSGRYLLALAIAELPYAIGTTLLGASFVSRQFGLLLSLGAVAALTAILLGRVFRRRLGNGSGRAQA